MSNYREMYYIQRYEMCSGNIAKRDSISRFIIGDYMGAAEFEFGAVSRSWEYLRNNRIGLFHHSVPIIDGRVDTQEFFVVTTPDGFERFKIGIGVHLRHDRSGRNSKEPTYLWEKFGALAQDREIDTNLWLDISTSSMTASYEANPYLPYGAPIVFTHIPALAIRVLLELQRKKIERTEPNVFDRVVTYRRLDTAKVCGLNDDGSISIKYPHGKATKMFPEDVWTIEDINQLDPEISTIFNF